MTALGSPPDAAFEPLADALRLAVLDGYRRAEQRLDGISGLRTLETNSGLAAGRCEALLRLLREAEPEFDLHGLTAVDLGCGFGSMAVYLAHLGARVTAVDINAERLEVGAEVARRFELPINWVAGSLEELPLADRSFDLALANNSLCYLVPRPERLIALVHIRRVLRPGGHVLMCNPNRTALRDPFTGIPGLNRLSPGAAGLVARGLGRHRSRVRLLSARGQRAELRRVGFEVIATAAAGHRTLAPIEGWAASYQHVLARRPPAG